MSLGAAAEDGVDFFGNVRNFASAKAGSVCPSVLFFARVYCRIRVEVETKMLGGEVLLVIPVQGAVGVAGLLYIWSRLRALWSVLATPDNAMPRQWYQELGCPADIPHMLRLYHPLTSGCGIPPTSRQRNFSFFLFHLLTIPIIAVPSPPQSLFSLPR